MGLIDFSINYIDATSCGVLVDNPLRSLLAEILIYNMKIHSYQYLLILGMNRQLNVINSIKTIRTRVKFTILEGEELNNVLLILKKEFNQISTFIVNPFIKKC